MNHNPKVPAGLKRCSKCGHYKGKCMFDGEQWDISCVCKLSICRKCGKPVYKYKITSNIYEEKAGKCWHVPICAAMVHRCQNNNN
ncbi:hypothetical protein ACFL3T_04925 [Patescibacteria group bacterium]